MTSPANKPPLVALTLGDPAGIGPEIVFAALRAPEVRRDLRILCCGPAVLRPDDVPLVEGGFDPNQLGPSSWLATAAPGTWESGRPQAAAGQAAYEALRSADSLARAGRVAALVTAPVSKEALHLAGYAVEGQTQLFERWSSCQATMLAVADRLRVALVTRHLPLLDALHRIDAEAIVACARRMDEGLRAFGWPRPRLALAGWNPHAGEGGLLGSEDRELLQPAVDAARAKGVDLHGPLSPDTVFLQASRGAFDGVVALYHDQGFIPVKLHAPDTALTVLLGLPYLRISPAHGTAFDIAGTGRANPANLIAALLETRRWLHSARSARTQEAKSRPSSKPNSKARS